MTDTSELNRLQQQIRATIKERMDIERHLANPDALRAATARAYRDRDAVTNPRLDEERTKITEDIGAFHDQWNAIDFIADKTQRLAPFLDDAPDSVRAHRDAILTELPSVRNARAAIANRLAAAGLANVLPEAEPTDG